MELSSVSNTQLTSSQQKISTTKVDETVTANKADVSLKSEKKATTDSVNISAEATKTLANEQVSSFHGGGVYVPPDV